MPTATNYMKITAYADGASSGNPGPAAIGVYIVDENDNQIATVSRVIGIATNNQAEYRAAIAALEMIARLNPPRATLHLDSELVARQLSGAYRVKSPSVAPLYLRASDLKRKLPNVTISTIRGTLNDQAHNLAQMALRKARPKKTNAPRAALPSRRSGSPAETDR